ncbi:four helix bundle protein [Plebeiibacterium marinum]|uniref:Four helix bundle protein n=1 Tax=Plebeiibacterium marinum TaxID=2992111 RepID=A0AAE3MB11_9BACT|nr:four helix bundle protein [Plebeiobacterium marinum]MCW3804418.1 four helix bundle protein [Plebeiobacterium marinum]
MKQRIEKFEDLSIWQEGVDLASEIYGTLSGCKDYGMRDQMQRAAVSIPSNIAEGFERQTNNEFLRFLKIAKGSCGELRTQLIISNKIRLITNGDELIDKTRTLSSKIQKLISYREKIRKENKS